MFLSYAFGAFVLFFVLLGQTRVRVVRRMFQPRLPVFLGVIGLFEMLAYSSGHHLTPSAWAWVLGTMAGALGLGALRGLSTKVWASNGWVVRLATAGTMLLWLLSLLAPFVVNAAGTHTGSTGLEGAGFLLYLGLTIGAQSFAEYRRALPLWAQLGPEAGRPLQFNFSQGPGTVFATFWTNGAPPGWGPDEPAQHDPNIIDAEVVEDDDEQGPPELHAPH